MNTNQITLSDRLVAGFMSSSVMALMVVFAPIGAMFVITKGRCLEVLGVFGSFHIWGVALIVVAGITAAGLGIDRTTTLFGHLWGTEEPRRGGSH